ncbi:MAG: hypothetical protein KGL59_01540 [Acidobacteriota bacterium]|nr:hypothetical protein [Acidobacteriota bacterium]
MSVNDALASAPPAVAQHVSEYGSASLLYFWRTPGVAVASIQVMSSGQSLVFDYPFLPSQTGKAATQTVEGLWWMHDPGTQGFVAATNNTATPRNVTVTASDNSGSPSMSQDLSLASHATHLLSLESLLPGHSRGPDAAGGVQVQFKGQPSDISLAGGLMNPANGFSATMRFVIPGGHAGTPGPMRLASAGVLMGKQPSFMGFPATTRFLPYVVLRNTGAVSLPVLATVYKASGPAEGVALHVPALAAFESRRISMRPLLDSAGLAGFDGAITLAFSWQGRWGDLVAAVGSVDQSGNYVFEVSPTIAHQTWAKESPFWVVGNGDDTMFSLWNSGRTAEDVSATFTFGSSSGRYTLPIHLTPGETQTIDMAQLIAKQQPDADGDTTPPGPNEGSAMFSGAQGPRQQINLVVSTGQYNAQMGTCCEGCICCYGVVSLDLLADPTECPTLEVCYMSAKENMSDGTQNDVTGSASWRSGNTSIATVSGGTVNAYTPGNTSIGTSIEDQEAGQVCGTLLVCNFNQFANSAALNVCGFTLGPKDTLYAQTCDALTDNSQVFTATNITSGCSVDASQSSCSFTGGQYPGDPTGTAEVHPDGMSYNFGNGLGPQCTASYTAGPPDASNNGGVFSLTMNLKFYSTSSAVSQTVSGTVVCPSN